MKFSEKGIQDIILATSIISGLIVLGELFDKKEAADRQKELSARLDRIEKGIENLGRNR